MSERKSLSEESIKECIVNNKESFSSVISTLEKNKIAKLNTKGNSMLPVLREGDIITLSCADSNQLKIGDIIAYYHHPKEKIVVHRLVRKRDSFLTKGDAIFDMDSPIRADNILGKIIFVERNNRIIKMDRFSCLVGFILSYLKVFWFIFSLERNMKTPHLIPRKIYERYCMIRNRFLKQR